MNLFKIAYKVVRSNSKIIYKGFGFKHLSDGTQYYVHPDNQSYKGTTTLCQPIGEAVILFCSMLSSVLNKNNENPIGNYWFNQSKNEFLLELNVPEDYRENKVVEPEIFSYKVYLKGEVLILGAFDIYGNLVKGNMEHIHPLYKLLPIFCILIAREMERNNQYRSIIEKFLESPAPDTFVNLNEDLYQMHKMDEYIEEKTFLNISSFPEILIPRA
jgi:hypothetical protein